MRKSSRTPAAKHEGKAGGGTAVVFRDQDEAAEGTQGRIILLSTMR